MDGHVKPEFASSRMARLLEAAQECENSFFMSQIGSRAEVLVERPCEDGFVEGFSKNYTPIRIKGDYERGSIISVTITGTNAEYCTAE